MNKMKVAAKAAVVAVMGMVVFSSAVFADDDAEAAEVSVEAAVEVVESEAEETVEISSEPEVQEVQAQEEPEQKIDSVVSSYVANLPSFAAPEPEPAPQPEPTPEPEPQPAPQPEPTPEPTPQPAPQPAPQPEPQPASQPETKVVEATAPVFQMQLPVVEDEIIVDDELVAYDVEYPEVPETADFQFIWILAAVTALLVIATLFALSIKAAKN